MTKTLWLGLALLLVVPTLAVAAQSDWSERAQMRAEIRREVREAVREARCSEWAARREIARARVQEHADILRESRATRNAWRDAARAAREATRDTSRAMRDALRVSARVSPLS